MEIKVVIPNAWLQIDVRLDEQAKLMWLDTYCEHCEEDNIRLCMTEHGLQLECLNCGQKETIEISYKF